MLFARSCWNGKLTLLAVLLAGAQSVLSADVRYVSSAGDDANDGRTPERAWRSLEKVNAELPAGGEVRLRRGDVFSGCLRVRGGEGADRPTVVSAWGEGAAPVVSLYRRVRRDPKVWVSVGKNLWRLNLASRSDFAGNLGKKNNFGFIKVDGRICGNRKFGKEALAAQWDYREDAAHLVVWNEKNPAEAAKDICLAPQVNGLELVGNLQVRDIVIEGTGAHGATGSGENILIENCEFREIGGSILFPQTGLAPRYGNGVQLWTNSAHVAVKGCRFKDIYDVAVTLQGRRPSASWADIVVSGCQIERCSQAYEIWATDCPAGIGFERCEFVGNRCSDIGFGWGFDVRPTKATAAPLLVYQVETDVCDVRIADNDFSNSRQGLVYKSGGLGALPPGYRISGNRVRGTDVDPVGVLSGKRPSEKDLERASQIRRDNDVQESLPPYYAEPVRAASEKIRRHRDADGCSVSFWFITDLHVPHNRMRSGGLLARLIGETSVEKVFCGGDLASAFGSARDLTNVVERLWEDHWRGPLERTGATLFLAKGNHDFSIVTDRKRHVRHWYSSKDAAQVMLRCNGNAKLVGNAADPGSCYGYYDDTASDVRFVLADTSDIVRTGGDCTDARGHDCRMSEKQLAWMAEVALGSVPKGRSVVVVQHIPMASGVSDNPKDRSLDGFRALLSAYQQRGSCTVAGKSCDFGERCGGDVLMDISGHHHSDRQSFEGGCLHLSIACDAAYQDYIRRAQIDRSLPKKDGGTRFEQTFDCIQVNPSAGVAYATRVGGGSDRIYHLKPVVVSSGESVRLKSSLATPLTWTSFDCDACTIDKRAASAEKYWTFRRTHGSVDPDGVCSAGTSGPMMVVARGADGTCEFFPVEVKGSESSARLARTIAEEGIVLLKNRNRALPLEQNAKVAFFAPAFGEWKTCGGFSCIVDAPYAVDVETGLRNAGFDVDPAHREVAVFVVSRDNGRGGEPDVGAYELKDCERARLREIEAMGFEKIVIVLNTGISVSVSEFAADDRVSAILQVGYPGMEGGNAIGRILSGAVNPSGRLPRTLAKRGADYPSDATWQESLHSVPYEEDVFVGYRYFETIPGKSDLVEYPFGFGLSYTEFSLSDIELNKDDQSVRLTVTVENTGKCKGRRSVLVYSSHEGGSADHPLRELRAFAKTRELAPGERERLELRFPLADLRCFDDDFQSETCGSWLLDGGRCSVWVGGDVRDVQLAGSFELDRRVLSRPGLRLVSVGPARRLRANGTYREIPVAYGAKEGPPQKAPDSLPKPQAEKLLFSDLKDGRCGLQDFVEQMSVEEMVHLLRGGRNLAKGADTGSIGRFEKYGLPGLQTADGPLGVRLADGVKSTQFPATDLLVGTFDVALAERFGKALGSEARSRGVDILLAPGVNLSRHPTCAREIEFMGEDPLLSGKMGAAEIRGIQSAGVAATIKHFAAHNRINGAKTCGSILSERAAREIYLKPFEIAIAESSPKCLMTAYNEINGCAAGAHWGLIQGILRDEWGYGGVVVTDWGAQSRFWREIAAGGDVKMPNDGGESAFLAKSVRNGFVSRARIRESAIRVLGLVLEMGKRHPAGGGKERTR